MRSRMVREGSVGLLILVGLAMFGGLILWVRGIALGNRSYRIIIEFDTVAGLEIGAPVRYRGVRVGRIVDTRPGPKGVQVEAEISPVDLIIPRDATIEANQSGLLGAATIDITPKSPDPLNSAQITHFPLDQECDRNLIICDEARLQGQVGVSVDDLVRASVKFANVYSSREFQDKVGALAQNSAEAAKEIANLSREFGSLSRRFREELATFARSARSFSSTADKLGLTIDEVNSLLATNRATLVSTLDNIQATTAQLRQTVSSLSPIMQRVQGGDLLTNLETLSKNAAEASQNLRDVTQALNDPTNLVVLQQTLDAARATFQNAQKITSDLDEFTGDPEFRRNLRNLVNGLSNLVSSTEQLQQQARVAQVLSTAAQEEADRTPAHQSAAQPATPVRRDR